MSDYSYYPRAPGDSLFNALPACSCPDPALIRNAALEEAALAVAASHSAVLGNDVWDAALRASERAIRALKAPVPK